MTAENTIIVETEGLSKAYANGPEVLALDDINMSAQKGEFVSITGHSGSGKTTLLNLLGALDRPSRGRVDVDGIDLNTMSGDALADFRRRTIGFIFQLFNLVPFMTALENVMLPLIPYQREIDFHLETRARALLKAVGISERAQHLPGQMSGGEQQRVAIARALINRPKLILADEPTGNVDSKTGAEIMDLLRRLQKEHDVCILLATHNDALAEMAERVIVLHDGRMMESSL
jgi:ABC-type lipoprotein export system ATPase subunit